jgi:hypothetical protein
MGRDVATSCAQPPQARGSTTPAWKRWVMRGAAALCLGAAVAVPFAVAAWGLPAGALPLASLVVSIGVGAAVLFSPRGDVPGGIVFYILRLLFPSVDRYVQAQQAVIAANRCNARRHADMSNCLLAYRLIDQKDIADGVLEPPLLGPGTREIGLNRISATAAGITQGDSGKVPDPNDPVSRCLRILYCSHFPSSITNDEKDAARQDWQTMDDSLLETLSGIVSQHEVIQLLGPNANTKNALGQMKVEAQPYELQLVVELIRQQQTNIVSSLRTVAGMYGYPSITDTQANKIAMGLAGAASHNITEEAAKKYAAAVAVQDDGVTARQLELLLREHLGWPTFALWQKLDKQEREVLAVRMHGICRLGTQLTSKQLVEVFSALHDFDIELASEACVSLLGLQHLVIDFVEDCRRNDVPPSARWSDHSISTSLVEYLRIQKALPGVRADLQQLSSPDLALQILRQVADDSLADLDFPPDDAKSSPGDELGLLAFVTVGLYLIAGQRRLDLAPVIAKHARNPSNGSAAISDRVAEVLLARMWFRQEQIMAGKRDFIPLERLLCRRYEWLESAKREYGDPIWMTLLADIAQQVRQGCWPTRLPVEWLITQAAERILEESGNPGPGSHGVIHDVQEAVDHIASEVDPATSCQLENLVEKILGFEPAAQATEQARNELAASLRSTTIDLLSTSSLDTVSEAIGSLASIDREMVDAVHELKFTDDGLAHQVTELKHADDELRDAVEQLAEVEPSTSRRYLLTFRTRRGGLSPLITHLSQPKTRDDAPKVNDYHFDDVHAPYVRIGVLPKNIDFGSFVEQLKLDLNRVYRWKKDSQDVNALNLEDAHVTVQLIGSHHDLRIG